MTWLNGYRMRLVLVGVVAAIVLGGGNANADFTIGEPTNLGPPVNSSSRDGGPDCSADDLSLFFHSDRGGILEIWMTTRAKKEDPWGEPVSLGLGASAHPSISADGLSLFFESNRSPGSGKTDLWVTIRAAKDDPWSTPVNLGPVVNSPDHDLNPEVSPDGLTLYFRANRPGGSGGHDIWMTTRSTTEDEWGQPVNIGAPINNSGHQTSPNVSADGLMLFFVEYPRMIYAARRSINDDKWESPAKLDFGEFASISIWPDPSVSADGSTLYFKTGDWPNYELWQAPILPIVDFNGDGIVDSADMCIIVDNWGTDESLCDIGPMPWGDGIVNIEDLKVLAEHLFEEPRLIAYWMLDETEGDTAYDSAGEYDGTLHGEPVWQPDGGMVAGTLQFDGIDDYVSTDSVLNPADGSFSIFAWVNGGAPGQVIVSQQGFADCLTVDAEGNLMTELKCTGRSAGPLFSETIITDGQWHRIGLVWDGSNRILYVDGVAVAEDTKPGLQGSQMGLYIGVGKNYASGTFWSGLIDDVRIYNRAVSP